MRLSLQSLSVAAVVAGCAAAPRGGPVSDADLAITHVAVVDVERGRVVADQTALLKGNRILSVAPSAGVRLASTVRVIDGKRKYVTPGLWDMHAHLALSGSPMCSEMPLMVAHGVTGVRIMGSDRPSAIPNWTPGLDQHRAVQAQVTAGTLTGHVCLRWRDGP